MKIPKRRKKKDNPYCLIYNSPEYKIEIHLENYQKKQIIVSKEIYEQFNLFELQDLKEMNEYDNHIEHSQLQESTIYKRAINIDKESVEDKVLRNDIYRLLYISINKLKSPQKERIIMYYFENFTLEEIAKKQGCSKVAIKYSIDRGLINLKIIMNKNID